MPNERNFGRETQAWRISSSIGALDISRYRSSPLTKQGAKETTVFGSSWERGQPNVALPNKFSSEIPALTGHLTRKVSILSPVNHTYRAKARVLKRTVELFTCELEARSQSTIATKSDPLHKIRVLLTTDFRCFDRVDVLR